MRRRPGEPPPGTLYQLGVPIEIESGRRGFPAVGDKESRRGCGLFLTSDRRTLSLFANQAALALENARPAPAGARKGAPGARDAPGGRHPAPDPAQGPPSVAGFELCGWNRPARQVGGDYYDLFSLGGGSVGVLVGDVSGKGMPAALPGVDPALGPPPAPVDQTGFGPPLFERLNRHLLESSTPNKFVTLLLAELLPEAGVLNYLNVGHNPGILLRADGRGGGAGVERRASGCCRSPATEMQSLGDRPGRGYLCLYSDGITEAESPDEEEFGFDRLVDGPGREPRAAPARGAGRHPRRRSPTSRRDARRGTTRPLVLVRRTRNRRNRVQASPYPGTRMRTG